MQWLKYAIAESQLNQFFKLLIMKSYLTCIIAVLFAANLFAQSADFMGIRIPTTTGSKGEPMLIVKMKKKEQTQLGDDMNAKVVRLKDIPETDFAKFDYEMRKQQEFWQEAINTASAEQNDFLKNVAQYNLAFIYMFTDNMPQAEKLSAELQGGTLHKDHKAKIARLIEIYKKKPLSRPEIAEAYVESADEDAAYAAKKSKVEYKNEVVSIDGTEAYKIVRNKDQEDGFDFISLGGAKFLNVEINYFNSTCNGIWYKATDNDGKIAYFEANPNSMREGANLARFLSSENYVVTPTGEINSIAFEKAIPAKTEFDKVMQKHLDRKNYNSLVKDATKDVYIKFNSPRIIYRNFGEIEIGNIFVKETPMGVFPFGMQVVVMKNDTVIAKGTLNDQRDGGTLTIYKIVGQGKDAKVLQANDIVFDKCACSSHQAGGIA